jgi:hypothetical protein
LPDPPLLTAEFTGFGWRLGGAGPTTGTSALVVVANWLIILFKALRPSRSRPAKLAESPVSVPVHTFLACCSTAAHDESTVRSP